MKRHITPRHHEKVMRDEDFIVSKTDTKGRITYANRIFVEFSGYRPQELFGAQHNIIRHPDMPRGVFSLLWETLKAGQEIFAYVKNMSKDGSQSVEQINGALNQGLATIEETGESIGRLNRRGARSPVRSP